MKWIWMAVACGALGSSLGRAPASAADAGPRAGAGAGSGDPAPVSEHSLAHGGSKAESGEVCATGCAAAPALGAVLGPAEFRRLLALWTGAPEASARERALETLLFHGARTRELGASLGFGGLDPGRRAFLQGELARDHALLSVRLVNDAGDERLRLPPTRVPLGVKQHLVALDTRDLQPPEVSGTVRRVGLAHLWVRL